MFNEKSRICNLYLTKAAQKLPENRLPRGLPSEKGDTLRCPLPPHSNNKGTYGKSIKMLDLFSALNDSPHFFQKASSCLSNSLKLKGTLLHWAQLS